MKREMFGDFNPHIEKLIKKNHSNYKNRTLNRTYAISNEELTEVFSEENLTGKRVAVVGSSGDQALNAILCGSNDVTIIDGNDFAECFIEYKIAIIKTYSFKEFKNLFFKSQVFDWKVYAKISHLLSNREKLFWDSVMLEQTAKDDSFDEVSPKSIKENLFFVDHRDRFSSFYFYEDQYTRLQNLLNGKNLKISYVFADVQAFPYALSGEYDYIYLSNIYDYFYNDDKKMFKKAVAKLYKMRLAPSGKLIFNYNFCENMQAPNVFAGHKVKTKKFYRVYDGMGYLDEIWQISKPQKTLKTKQMDGNSR